MTDEEYKKLFIDVQQKEQQGFGVSENNIPQHQNPYNNINETFNNPQWQQLNETPDVSQYKIDENINGGWGTNEFQVETRVNGVKQNQNTPFQHQQRRKSKSQDLNGLEQFLVGDEEQNLNEVVKQPLPTQIETPQPNIEDVDIVTVEMFEKMNQRGLLDLHNNIFS